MSTVPLPERMDDPGLPVAESDRALADLERVHRWAGNEALLRSLRPLLVEAPERLRLLHVGAGGGVVSRTVDRCVHSLGCTLRTLELDLKLAHLTFGAAGRNALQVVGDARRLPFRDGSVDFTVSTLFQHHFDDRDGGAVLAEMRRVADRAAVLSDLRESWLGRWLGCLVLTLLRLGPTADYDGRLSLRQAWSAERLRRVAGDAAIVELRRRWPFRWSAVLAPGSDPPKPTVY